MKSVPLQLGLENRNFLVVTIKNNKAELPWKKEDMLLAKIDTLKEKTKEFVRKLHLDGLHWGCVNTFGTEVNLGKITNQKSEIIRQISSISTGGCTALYESISQSIEYLCDQHYEAGRQGIPMMVLTFTDGYNEGAGGSIQEVRRAIERYDFFPSNNCYLAIAGIGVAKESAMKQICNGGYGLYTHSNNIEDIFMLFINVVAKIAMQVGARYQGVHFPGLSIEQVRPFVNMFGAVFPIDYVLNLDKSGSMGGGLCFISTAVIEGLGKADDCEELERLRFFRDEVMIRKLKLHSMIEEYYRVAPQIVAKINQLHNLKKLCLYQQLYLEYILPCLQYIRSDEYTLAVNHYKKMVIHLSKICNIEIDFATYRQSLLL